MAAITLALFIIPVGAIMSPAILRYPMPTASWGELVGLAVIASVVLFGLYVALKLLNRRFRVSAALTFGLVLAQAFNGTRCGWEMADKMQCGAWMLLQSWHLRDLGEEFKVRIKNGESLPDSTALYLYETESDWLRIFATHCGSCRLQSVSIGRYTLADLYFGRITKEEMESEAKKILPHPDGWEIMGEYAISHEANAWLSGSATVITAYARPGGPYTDPQGFSVLFADGHAEWVTPWRYKEFDDSRITVICAIAEARRNGMKEPPLEFIEALGITEEEIGAVGRPHE